MGLGKGTDVRLLREIRFPHSLGLLYLSFTAFLGFEVNEGEYKVMGMALYGKPRYLEQVCWLMEAGEDGSVRLNMEYCSLPRACRRRVCSRSVGLFGPSR